MTSLIMLTFTIRKMYSCSKNIRGISFFVVKIFVVYKTTVYKRTVPKPDIASKFKESTSEDRWVSLNNYDLQFSVSLTRLVNDCIIK